MLSLRSDGPRPLPTSAHRLQPGLPGYLIPFAPLAFAPERQVPPRTLPSPLVFLRISTHFTAPPGIPRPSPRLKSARLVGPLPVEPGDFTTHKTDRLRTLYAQ